MFDATEAINDIIDDINNDYYESCHDAIYEELCERVDSGELTIEDAEMINEAAADKYLTEAGLTDNNKKIVSIAKQIKTKTREIKKEAKSAKTATDIKKVISSLDECEKLHDELKKEVKSIDENSADKLNYVVRNVLAPSLILGLVDFVAREILVIRLADRENIPEYTMNVAQSAANNVIAGIVGKTIDKGIIAIMDKYMTGEYNFMSYKRDVLLNIEHQKKVITRLRKKLEKKLQSM